MITLKEEVPSFVTSICHALLKQGVDVSGLQADHVCYRTETQEQYTSLVEALSRSSQDFSLLVESEVGGRLIATFKLKAPIHSSDGNHAVDVVEIPSPKEGSPYSAGLEHVEFVIGNSTNMSPKNSDDHQDELTQWMRKHSQVEWNSKGLKKTSNPDVSTTLILDKGSSASAKFHLLPLELVLEAEKIEA